MPSTRNQEYAERAFASVSLRRSSMTDQYASFAKSFPALLHGCGLCQAVAFAEAKQHSALLDDVVAVLHDPKLPGRSELACQARTKGVTDYLRLSRDVLSAAVWIKRYVEALEA